MRRSARTLLVVGLVVIAGVGWAASVPGQGVSASSAPTASEAEVQALRERAAAFWAARVSGDTEAQWQLLEPRWKGQTTAAEYGADLIAAGGKWLAYQVEDVTVTGYFATVRVRLLILQPVQASAAGRVRASPQGAVVEDGWIRVRGVWYRRLSDGRVPSQTGQQ